MAALCSNAQANCCRTLECAYRCIASALLRIVAAPTELCSVVGTKERALLLCSALCTRISVETWPVRTSAAEPGHHRPEMLTRMHPGLSCCYLRYLMLREPGLTVAELGALLEHLLRVALLDHSVQDNLFGMTGTDDPMYTECSDLVLH